MVLTLSAVQQLSQSPSKRPRKISKVVSLVMLKSLSHSRRKVEMPAAPASISAKAALNSKNLSTLATKVTSLNLVMSTRMLNISRLRLQWVALLLNSQPLPRELLVLRTNLRVSKRTRRTKSHLSQNLRDLLSSRALSRVFSADRTKTTLKPTRTFRKFRRSLPNRSKSMRLSLLARKVSKLSTRSNVIITRVEKTTMVVREKVTESISLIINKMTTTMKIAMVSSMSKRKESVEENAEVDAVDIAEVVVASIVTMITSTAEVVTSLELIKERRDPKRSSKLPSRPQLHRRKKKLRSLSLLISSLAGMPLFSERPS